MSAWYKECVHESQVGMHSIDLVCGPSNIPNVVLTEMAGSLDPQKLSVHAGYVSRSISDQLLNGIRGVAVGT